jgi:hypothetical protein
MLVSALAVLPVAATRPSRRLRGALEALAVLGTLSLPWAVPALLSQAATDPAGVDAFAARADGPFGTLGSLVSLGGIWNAEAEVPGQAAWLLATARLLLAAVAVVTFVRLPWTLDRAGETAEDGSAGTPPFRRGLLIAAAAGLAIASTGAYAPGALKAMIGFWPGFGPLRDGQLYVAPLVLVQAIGFGVFSGRFSRPSPRGGKAAVVVPGVVAVLVPLLVLPAFAWGASGRLAAVEYPGEWRRVQAIVNRDPRPGALISLPWGAHRAFAWNGGRVILDPATKSFARRVIWNDALVVGLGGRGSLRVSGEDLLGRRIGMVITARDGPLTQALRAAGIRYVLITGRNENKFRSRLPGAVPAFVGNEVLLLRL